MAALFLVLLLCAPPSAVAFGDSWTVGYGAYSRQAMWTERLGYPVENLAVAGSTVAEQVEVIRSYQGSATTALWFSCTNDLFKQTPIISYTASISEGVSLLQQRGIVVRLGTCPGLKERAGLPNNWPKLQEGYNEGITGIAGVWLVDVDAVYDAETMEASFLPNHPSDIGHAAIARAFLGYRAWLPVVAF
jgi:hypothetical protein